MKFGGSFVDGTVPSGMARQNKINSEIDEQTADFIGEKLRAEFSDILNQPIPERFIELIRQLELENLEA